MTEMTQEGSRYIVSDQVKAQIENTFTYHAPKGNQQERYVALRDQAKKLAYAFAESVNPSRELSLALTHLETAVMFANAGIARNE